MNPYPWLRETCSAKQWLYYHTVVTVAFGASFVCGGLMALQKGDVASASIMIFLGLTFDVLSGIEAAKTQARMR